MKSHSKEIFYSNIDGFLLDLYAENKSSYWKLLRYIVKNSGYTSHIPPLKQNINDDSPTLFSDLEKAEKLNAYFESISHLNDDNAQLPEFPLRSNEHLDEILVNKQEISDVIKCIPLNKASGPDRVSHTLLKKTADTVSQALCLLFNMSLQSGVYPDMWKSANVMPLFKKGDSSVVSNYRPISLISCIGKLFERVVYKHLYNYFHVNKLLYKYQSGFQAGHSTVHQLIELYHQICKSLDNKEKYCMIFCDVSKAFDRVWHKGLILKLEMYAIRGKLLQWISSNITHRNQQVFVNGAKSKPRYLTAGVPQGSVLGPFLFVVYVNDIADKLDCITRLFADDTSLGKSLKNIKVIETSLNANLNTLCNWSKDWLISYNPDKTEAVVFSTMTEIEELRLYFDGKQINLVNNHRHLGIIFESNGKWSCHIDHIVNSCSKMISSMRKLKYLLNRNTLNKIYKMFIRPHFEYACELWDGCTIEQIEKLEKLQLEAARIVTGLPKYTSRQILYYETGWETLEERRKRRKLCLFYKIQNNLAPAYLQDITPDNVGTKSSYALRNVNNIIVPSARLKHSYDSFLPSTIRLWNDIPEAERNRPSLQSFKSYLQCEQPSAPPYYSFGIRKFNIIHTKLRYMASQLNYDLYRYNLKDSAVCFCGNACENVYHFIFDCNRYIKQREVLCMNLKRFVKGDSSLTLSLLLYGSPDLTIQQNEYIFKCVQAYICQTKRFV